MAGSSGGACEIDPPRAGQAMGGPAPRCAAVAYVGEVHRRRRRENTANRSNVRRDPKEVGLSSDGSDEGLRTGRDDVQSGPSEYANDRWRAAKAGDARTRNR